MATRTLDVHDRPIVTSYQSDLLSGRTFALHAASARSRHGYMPPITRHDWAVCMSTLAAMARESDALAQVASTIIGRVNLYGDDSQAMAAVYEAAHAALSKGFDDVIGRAAPDAGRHSDHQRVFSLRERTLIACWLELACRPFDSGAPGIGWCLRATADELGVRVPKAVV